MTGNTPEKQKIGILAYGSLISDPGPEIENAMIANDGYIIGVYTPFSVEFARKSSTRGNAPTLVPIRNGKKVKGQVFIMNWPKEKAECLRNILYRRERDMVGKCEVCEVKEVEDVVGSIDYSVKDTEEKIEDFINKVEKNIRNNEKNTGSNKVFVDSLKGFAGLQKVFFTKLYANIKPLTATNLACLAILSVAKAGPGRDGISYLINAKREGIVTALSLDYEKEVLRLTESMCLDQAKAKVHADVKLQFRAKKMLDIVQQ